MPRFFPLLLKPTLLTIRNRLRRRDENRHELLRNGFLLGMTLGVMGAAYFGGLWVLEQTKTQIDFAYFQASMLLGLILFFLMSLLTITNTIAAVSALYLSKDLSLLVSSPVSSLRFFYGKYVEVLLGSSWMTGLFLLPVLAVFATFYHSGWQFFLWCLIVLPPYFLIPAALALILATVFSIAVPLKLKRELFLISVMIGFVCLYSLGRTVAAGFEGDSRIDLVDMLNLVSMLSFANKLWIPSYWVAQILGEVLEPSHAKVVSYITLLYATTVASIALAFLSVRLGHFRGLSRQGLGLQGAAVHSQQSQARAMRLLWFCTPQTRALVVKEFKTAVRDVTQSVNIVLLFGLFCLYLYMLSFQSMFQQMFPGDQQNKWKFFLLITNICLEAFVVTAIGTRLVYPSISRESRAYWVLRTAPITIRQLLRVKFFFWYILVFLCTSVFFGIAAYLAYGSFGVVLLKTSLNALLTFSIVGMGMGFGAYFANFTWEHPSQLTTGFGSLVYMLTGVSLIAVSLVLTTMALWLGVAIPKMHLSTPYTIIGCVSCAAMVFFLTIGSGLWAMKRGAESLDARR